MSGYYTTAALVEGILSDYNPITDLTPFIATAHELVVNVCNDPDYGTINTMPTLELIERWLAAYFYTIQNPSNQLYSDRAGDTAETFRGKTGMNLAANQYGQTAMMLDRSGGLARLNNGVMSGRVRTKMGIFTAGRRYYPGVWGWGYWGGGFY